MAKKKPIQLPRLFIEEWMIEKNIFERQTLATKMGTTPGNITKKLQKPENIDIYWLETMRVALGLEGVADLFRHPGAASKEDILLTRLLSAWPNLSDDFRDNLARFAETYLGEQKKSATR